MAPHGDFPCQGADSWVAIEVRSDAEWARPWEIMGNADLASNHPFAKLAGRLRHVVELEQAIAQWTRDQEVYVVIGLLQAQGIPCALVLKAREVLENPQPRARDVFEEVSHPQTDAYLQAGTPWRLTLSPRRVRTAAPALGQHCWEVLSTLLGLSEDESRASLDKGITGDTPTLDSLVLDKVTHICPCQ